MQKKQRFERFTRRDFRELLDQCIGNMAEAIVDSDFRCPSNSEVIAVVRYAMFEEIGAVFLIGNIALKRAMCCRVCLFICQ